MNFGMAIVMEVISSTNWMALLPIKFQTGSAWAYTQEYMEFSGVLLYLFNINNYEQHNLICIIGKIIPYE